jgi:hypothetical protein
MLAGFAQTRPVKKAVSISGRISAACRDNLQMHRSFGGIPIEVNCPG